MPDADSRDPSQPTPEDLVERTRQAVANRYAELRRTEVTCQDEASRHAARKRVWESRANLLRKVKVRGLSKRAARRFVVAGAGMVAGHHADRELTATTAAAVAGQAAEALTQVALTPGVTL